MGLDISINNLWNISTFPLLLVSFHTTWNIITVSSKNHEFSIIGDDLSINLKEHDLCVYNRAIYNYRFNIHFLSDLFKLLEYQNENTITMKYVTHVYTYSSTPD